MKIIIVGYGFVGKAVFNGLKDKHDLVIVDPKYTSGEIAHHPDADGIIICVPTPELPNGGCDSSIVANVLDQIPIFQPVLIKSTVTPSVVDALNEIYSEHSICYNPEFLRERSADQDFANQKHIVIGGEDPEYFWHDVFLEALPNCKLVLNCTDKESALVKYATNSFLAIKTSYFNQLYDVCQAEGLDFEVVRQLLGHDQRIGLDHTMVPGPDGERGWGGHCFPKDTKAFRKYAYGLNKPVTILDQAIDYNEQIRQNKP